jgi:tungstate transport system ATP-binding protein
VSGGDPILEVRGLRVRKGGADLLDIPALGVAPGETLSLIGPNGAGKSTLLLALSGIETPAVGELRFRGERVPSGSASLAYRRRIAMVFQEPLLFDTTVFGNVAAGLRLRGVAREAIGRRVGENLERFRIGHLADRSARTLSGGEAQRTSLARAMAVAPEILLLDEPFAALDPQAREELIEDLAHTLRETRTTTVFVTHDRLEAERLADRVAVLHQGRVRQVGPPGEILRRPADAFVAAFVGMENILPGRLERGPGGGRFAGERFSLEIAAEANPWGVGDGVRALVCVRPEDVTLAAPGETGLRNRFPATVAAVVPQGPFLKVTLDCGFRLVAAVPGRTAADLTLEKGRAVLVAIRPGDLHVVPEA